MTPNPSLTHSGNRKNRAVSQPAPTPTPTAPKPTEDLKKEDKTMIQLDFTPEEEQHLRDEVKKRLTDLDYEIGRTDSINFKDMLKRRREAVRKFLEKLPEMGTPITGS
jgi:hypothetical protein